MDIEDEGAAILAEAIVGSAEKIPQDARVRVRARLVSAMRADRVPLATRLLRPAVAAITAATLLGGVSYAAAAAAPGDLLYPVKAQLARVVVRASHRPERIEPAEPAVTPSAPTATISAPARMHMPARTKAATPVVKPSRSKESTVMAAPAAQAPAKPGRGNGQGLRKSEPGHSSKNGSPKGRTQSTPRHVPTGGRLLNAQEAKK